MTKQDNSVFIDSLISFFNRLSYAGGGVTLGSLAAYKEQLSIIFAALALFFTALTFFMSLYFQTKRDKREVKEEERKAIIFKQSQEERRLQKKIDNGNRLRKTDK